MLICDHIVVVVAEGLVRLSRHGTYLLRHCMRVPLHTVEALPKEVRSVACWSNEGLITAGAGAFNMKWANGTLSTISMLIKGSMGNFYRHGHKNNAPV